MKTKQILKTLFLEGLKVGGWIYILVEELIKVLN